MKLCQESKLGASRAV